MRMSASGKDSSAASLIATSMLVPSADVSCSICHADKDLWDSSGILGNPSHLRIPLVS
jgi:hypothetical protein